jgi:DNA gyrase subunit A
MGVKTIQLTEKKGALAGALIVRPHYDLVFISRDGMVQRTSVEGISLYGRSSQGVRVMNLREGDEVSAVALVMETSTETAAEVADELPELGSGNGAEPAAEGADVPSPDGADGSENGAE